MYCDNFELSLTFLNLIIFQSRRMSVTSLSKEEYLKRYLSGAGNDETKDLQWHGIFRMNTANNFSENNFSLIGSRTKVRKSDFF